MFIYDVCVGMGWVYIGHRSTHRATSHKGVWGIMCVWTMMTLTVYAAVGRLAFLR